MTSKSALVRWVFLAAFLPAFELAVADSLSFRSARIPSGAATVATLAMDQAVARDVSFTVSVAGTNAAQAPTRVQLAAGQSRAEFPVTSAAATAEQFAEVAITDPGSGRLVARSRLTVTAPLLLSLALNKSEVVGGTPGTTVTGTVTLDGLAGGHGLAVTLGQSCTSCLEPLNLPASVLVPMGARTGSFSFAPETVPLSTQYTVSASQGSLVKSAALTSLPLRLQSLTVTPSSITGSQTATLTVTFNGPATSGYALRLTCSASLLVTVAGVVKPCAGEPKPVLFTAPAGQSSMSLQVQNNQATAPTQVTLRVVPERGNDSAQTTLAVAP